MSSFSSNVMWSVCCCIHLKPELLIQHCEGKLALHDVVLLVLDCLYASLSRFTVTVLPQNSRCCCGSELTSTISELCIRVNPWMTTSLFPTSLIPASQLCNGLRPSSQLGQMGTTLTSKGLWLSQQQRVCDHCWFKQYSIAKMQQYKTDAKKEVNEAIWKKKKPKPNKTPTNHILSSSSLQLLNC